MKGLSFSPTKTHLWNTPTTTTTNPSNQNLRLNPHYKKHLSFSTSANSTSQSQSPMPPLVVVGSANADIYVEISRLPSAGETIAAATGQTLAGGKGANQAACGARLSHPTFFVGQVGPDAHGRLVSEALQAKGVRVDYLAVVGKGEVPTGHAVVMLLAGGENSIVIVGGANMTGWPDRIVGLEVVEKAGIVLLQREIPDSVNLQVAQAAKSAGVLVILDAGGVDSPIPPELLNLVDIFSPNESELARLTGMPTENLEEITQAVEKCYAMGVKQVLVKLGAKGSALFVKGEEPIQQPVIAAKTVVDTTGAGDTFTASFAVALIEGKSKEECLRFAAAAASLCVQVKGAIPSMPDRKSVINLLGSDK